MKKQKSIPKPKRANDLPLTMGVFLKFEASVREGFKAIQIQFDQIHKRFDQVDKRFERVDKRFDEVDNRFDEVDNRFEQVDKRFEQVDKRFEQVDNRFEQANKRFEEAELREQARDLSMDSFESRIIAETQSMRAIAEEMKAQNKFVLDGYSHLFEEQKSLDTRLTILERKI